LMKNSYLINGKVNFKAMPPERLAEWYAGSGTAHLAAQKSTCQKRSVVCILLDKDNELVAAESNRCSPDSFFCPRLSLTTTKANYPADTCNSEHAEVRAMKVAKRLPKTAIIFGHTFFCDDCEGFLRGMGVENLIAGGMLRDDR
jgi:deoxycytidylate deaminase